MRWGPIMTAHDLLVVSNRLPDLRSPTGPGESRRRSVGGLVSALAPALQARQGLWLGWSGRCLPDDAVSGSPPVSVDADASPALAWIDFPESWHEQYYNGFCNGALWPLLHTLPERARFADDEWACYQRVNAAFAEAAASQVGPTTPIWVHDYHLLLLARELRRRGHRAPIGLFLHTPFPGQDVLRILPWADEVTAALLDFDLVGFHTDAYGAAFRRCVAALSPERAPALEGSAPRTRVGTFPIGIIPEGFREPAATDAAEEAAGLLQAIAPGRLVLGVDRLDYTKGIPERLYAFGRMLELFPEWRGTVSLVQISVPSRADVPDYAGERARVEGAVGRVNGEFGDGSWVPVRYLYRSFDRGQLSELYRAAAVGYVTPLRDGMNLVAKEYVAAQDAANPGVLLLSRFAGAAAELSAALLTNPWHREGLAHDLDRALRMALPERRARHARLRVAVERTTAATWAEDFLAALTACRPHPK
jgi:alpha,alpha-trehalose-phosphate synthase [UDP-forming]